MLSFTSIEVARPPGEAQGHPRGWPTPQAQEIKTNSFLNGGGRQPVKAMLDKTRGVKARCAGLQKARE
ncbi:hypothetical protein HaLaN_12635, partial [Haematococcus lacustris]